MLQKVIYNVEEAVEISRLSRATLYRAMGRGDIRSKAAGGRRLIEAKSLHAYIGLDFSEEATV